MHAKNKFVCLIAILLAAFALPSVAGNDKKIYNLQMQMVTVPPSPAPFTIQATLTSEPTGNSSFNSFSLSVVGLQIVGIVGQPTSGNATVTGSSVTVVNASPVKPGKSISVTLQVSSCGEGAWSASAWTGSKLNGQSFDLVPAHSVLATPIPCAQLSKGDAFTVPDSITPDCITGTRGYYDKNGNIPNTTLPFFVTNTIPLNDQVHFRWPDFQTGGDPFATFEYTVCDTGETTQVAWLNTDGSAASTPGTPAFINAISCIEPEQLPAPYGTLAAKVELDATTIAVNTTTTPLPLGIIPYPAGSHPYSPATSPGTQFDIIIGTERISVQLSCLDNDDDDPTDPNDCTETEPGEGEVMKVLARGVGGTPVGTHDPHVLVMSTPLPLLPATITCFDGGGHVLPAAFCKYQPLHQAQMCIAHPEDAPSNSTTFIDIGDGYVRLP